MRLWPLLSAFTAACVGTLVYGAVGAADQLVCEKRTLRLPKWPASLSGYRIGLLADLHLRDEYSLRISRLAVDWICEQAPDMVVIAGDLVGYFKPESPWLLEAALAPLRTSFPGRILAVPGNHEYWNGDPRLLKPVLDELGIMLLRNEIYRRDGIAWVGIDSMNALAADPFTTMAQLEEHETTVVIWHEPDAVELLPSGAALMLSGHSHAGQFRFPWGWTPMHTYMGEKYVEGFFPGPTPLYVSRGLGTTGPPSRLGVLPEVTVLTLASF